MKFTRSLYSHELYVKSVTMLIYLNSGENHKGFKRKSYEKCMPVYKYIYKHKLIYINTYRIWLC